MECARDLEHDGQKHGVKMSDHSEAVKAIKTAISEATGVVFTEDYEYTVEVEGKPETRTACACILSSPVLRSHAARLSRPSEPGPSIGLTLPICSC